jgi:hypothetical protein
VRITDKGGGKVNPEATTPDNEAKLAGEQAPRAWGLFHEERMVDEDTRTQVNGSSDVELIMNREGEA